MTTLFIDPTHKTIYSDSRNTITQVASGKVSYSTGAKKTFKSKDGKMIACTYGSVGISYRILKALGFEVTIPDCNTKGQEGGVLFLNSYNDTIYHRGYKFNETGKITVVRSEWFSNCNHLIHGSGGPTCRLAYNQGVSPEKAIRYAAMKDKMTDDRVQKVSLRNYRILEGMD